MGLFDKMAKAGIVVDADAMDKVSISTGKSSGKDSNASNIVLALLKTKVLENLAEAVGGFFQGSSDALSLVGLTSEQLRAQVLDYASTDVGIGSKRGRKTRNAVRSAQERMVQSRSDCILFRAQRAGGKTKLYGIIQLDDARLELTEGDKAQLCILFASQSAMEICIPSMGFMSGNSWSDFVQEEYTKIPKRDLQARLNEAPGEEPAEPEEGPTDEEMQDAETDNELFDEAEEA